MKQIIDFFDRYTKEYGWQIIPVYASSKIPVGIGWNSKYNLYQARSYIAKYPNVNLGLLLGECVDVEGDTPEANALLDSLLQGYEHPAYKSEKSTHHLFLSPDKHLTALRQNGIEFRGHRHYSVVPPSRHAGGIVYEWLHQPDGPLPAMPPTLLDFYERSKKKYQAKINFISPCCSMCGSPSPIHKKRYELEVKAFRHYDLPWQCRNCRKVDVRELCRKIRKWSRQRSWSAVSTQSPHN